MLRKATTAYSCLKPELIVRGIEYSFSYNPEDQPKFEQFYKVKLDTLKSWSEYYAKLFLSLKYASIYCVMEISSKGRFHYHGTISIDDIARFIINDLAKLRHYGTYEIDIINDKDKWDKYVHKQQDFMEKYCKDNDMIYEVQATE